MAGAVPDSFHAIDIAPPPGIEAPAAGVVNSTSARAKEASELNKVRRWNLMAAIGVDGFGFNQRIWPVKNLRVILRAKRVCDCTERRRWKRV